MKNIGIYKIINIKNSKIYVGSSINLKSRKWQHFWNLESNKHDNIKLQNSYNKHGKDNFEWEIIEYVEFNEDKEVLKKNLLEREQYWIDKYFGEKCYNIRIEAGNNLGLRWKLSDTSRKNIANALIGRPVSQETRDKIGKANSVSLRGKKLSEEHRKKLSNSLKGIKRKSMSEEQKEILRNIRKGAVLTEETKNKMKKSREKYNIPIKNVTTGELFKSIREASLKYNLDEGSIGKACKGILKKVGKFTWEYIKEGDNFETNYN